MPTLATFTQNIILQIKAIAIKKREIKGIEKKKKNRYIPCKKKEKKKSGCTNIRQTRLSAINCS